MGTSASIEGALGDRGARPVALRDVALAGSMWLLSLALIGGSAALAPLGPVLAAELPPSGDPRWWAAAGIVTVQSAALLLARRAAAVVLVAVTAVALTVSMLGPMVDPTAVPRLSHSLAAIPIAAAAAVAGARVAPREARWVLPTALLITAAGATIDDLPADGALVPLLVFAGLLQSLAIVGAPFTIAMLVTARRDVLAAQGAELRALGRERDALVQAAIAEDRTALARELHDIAAHHLSGIAVMAAAIEQQIDSAPEQAREGARQVRSQSRIVLDDLRRLVGLLRDDGPTGTEVHALAAIPKLATGALGDRVEVHVLPRPGSTEVGADVGPLAQLTGYRMVQESVANVLRHAPGSRCVATVDDRADARVVLTVRNDPPPLPTRGGLDPEPSGFGLRGMRERADLVGAVLRHGPTDDGGWEVRLELPRARSEALARMHDVRDPIRHAEEATP